MKKIILLALIACSLPSGAKNFVSYRFNNDYLVTCMTHDGQNLYVGTIYGLITIDKATGMQTLRNSTNSALPNDKVFSMSMHDGALWVGLDSACVSEITPEQTRNYQYLWNLFQNEFPYGYVTNIVFGPSGEMYITKAWDFALVVNGQIEEIVRVGSSYGERAEIEELKVDANGVLWIASWEIAWWNRSLGRYTPEGGIDYPMADFDDSLFPLGKDMMDTESMDVDANGHVWIGCRGGYLAEYDGETFRFYNTGIVSKIAFRDLAFDANGTLWVLVNDGRLVSRIGEEITVRQLELVEGEYCSILHVDGDTVYVGTNKRLIAWHDGQQTNIELATTNAVSSCTGSMGQKQGTCYDLQGRRLSGRPARGLYIVDGKKVLITK